MVCRCRNNFLFFGVLFTYPALWDAVLIVISIATIANLVLVRSSRLPPSSRLTLSPQFHFDPSIYANTLNAALNSRKHLRAIIDRSVEFSIAVDEPPEAACQIPNVVVV
ncbi:hypothetical protein HWV62_6789 [Athelia sp. TMB]|nr:hypothetical protein HWV62_6789 [Athelia sp. TMB]